VDYWDTSALLKLYAPEPDSAYFLERVAKGHRALLTADLAKVELFCALKRKEHAGDLQAGGAAALSESFERDVSAGRIVAVPYGQDVFTEVQHLVKRAYAASPVLMIRSLDAIHVASAILSKTKVVVATDVRLRDVAALMGLRTEP
jgi:predicted nucleic acid-binding protein